MKLYKKRYNDGSLRSESEKIYVDFEPCTLENFPNGDILRDIVKYDGFFCPNMSQIYLQGARGSREQIYFEIEMNY